MCPESDTIAAVSTAAGAGAIGIVRLSGPEAVDIAARAFIPKGELDVTSVDSHSFVYGHVVEPGSGRVIDEAMLAVMRAPRSYTREDIVELHCHGGPVALRSALQLVVDLGARIAEPGEFTRRAFINGRLDLAQAEGVAGIISARSTGALRVSVRQLGGGLSERLRSVRSELIGTLAVVEANMDFSDEDVEEVDWGSTRQAVSAQRERLGELLATALLGRALQHGVRTAIVGRPNAGKSSLLNALVMRERAIVSELPGTTRDTVEDELEIGGIPIRLVDTAGLRSDGEGVERLGIERSLAALEGADLVLVVVDLAATARDATSLDASVAEGGVPLEGDLRLILGVKDRPCIVVGNKTDLVGRESSAFRELGDWIAAARGVPADEVGAPFCVCEVSARTGEGVAELRECIGEVVSGGSVEMEEPVLVGERQRILVAEAASSLEEALLAIDGSAGDELVAEDLRAAVGALGRVTGEDLGVDLLDEIFGRFCLGK